MGTNNVAQILVPPHPETSSNSSETYSSELIYKKNQCKSIILPLVQQGSGEKIYLTSILYAVWSREWGSPLGFGILATWSLLPNVKG